MKKIKDYINIDKRFQNSINLQLDIENEKKINSYIPTRSSLNIMKKFLNHIIEDKDKANILIGPYGKGKSHLLLVLLAMISGNYQESLIEKIEKADAVTACFISEIRKRNRSFLPVIVSGTEGNANLAFLMGLVEALKRNNLGEIAPDSYYSEAVKTINMWREDYPATYEQLDKYLDKYNSSAESLLKELNMMQEKALKIFRKIYPKLTAGSEFRPLVQLEAFKIYKEINHVLCSENGYGGIYIIFDEFSKYVEGHEKDTFAKDMKVLQDMCELAQDSKNEQIHITFVAHKSIKEYGNSIPKEMINAFTGVEGRMKEERFIVSAQNNYELIRHVIGKENDSYKKVIDENKHYAEIIKESYKIPCFESMFTEKDYMDIVAYGCFPLLPLTSYCLLSISEKVAQNERSIFTFLANDEKGSLVRLLEYRDEIYGVDVIYDYFENLFRENKSLTNVHNEWLKADYALSKVKDEKERKIIKAAALLLMIRKPDEVPVLEKTLRLASGLGKEDFVNSMKNLQESQIIIFRKKLGTFAFKNNVGINIEKEIDGVIEKQPDKIDWAAKITEISDMKFALPKQYNQEYTMTRFFKYVYMMPERFLKISKADLLMDEYKADGLIICLLGMEEVDERQVSEQVRRLADKRLVVISPKNTFSQKNNVRKLMAVKNLMNDKEFIEENQVLLQELKLYEEDLLFEINAEIEETYMPENHKSRCYVCEDTKLSFDSEIEVNRYLSKIFKDYYEKAPKINNELINRQNISAPIRKARNQIIDTILEEDDVTKYEKGTSPAATIFRATMIHTGMTDSDMYKIKTKDKGCVEILKIIEDFIEKSAGRKVSFKELYKILMGEKYGARKGIIPIFLAKEISLLQDTPVIYLQDREVEISGEIFNNINDNPEDYYLYVEKESVDKEKYLTELEILFVTDKMKKDSSKMSRLASIVFGMQRWYRSLDQFTLNIKEQINENEQMSEDMFRQMCVFRNIFRYIELNPREVLFEQIPESLEEDGKGILEYELCAEKIKSIKAFMDNNLKNTELYMASEIKKIFGASEEESLTACLKAWYEHQSGKAKNHIYNDTITTFMAYVGELKTFDEQEIAEKISKIVYGIYISDWKDTSKQDFLDSVKNVKNQVESIRETANKESGENKISFTDSDGNIIEKYYDADDEDSTSYFLKNAIEDAMEEFGDSLEMNQKVSVLVQMIEKLIK